jgi:hypothetical protein
MKYAYRQTVSVTDGQTRYQYLQTYIVELKISKNTYDVIRTTCYGGNVKVTCEPYSSADIRVVLDRAINPLKTKLV